MATVLVVDDEADIVEGVGATIARRGPTVLTATSGREALDVIEASRPDVVVLDLSMPDVDGLEVLEQIRDWPDLADTAVIVYSAVADDDVVRQSAMKLGAVDFVTKGSATWDELADVVVRYLAAAHTDVPAV